MNKESLLTNFAIWLQATHSKETGLNGNRDVKLNELAREFLEWSGEDLEVAQKQELFPGYNQNTETCDYCFQYAIRDDCQSWHCHNCGYYSLRSDILCANCKSVRPTSLTNR